MANGRDITHLFHMDGPIITTMVTGQSVRQINLADDLQASQSRAGR